MAKQVDGEHKADGSVGASELAQAIVAAVQANQPPRRIEFDEYDRLLSVHRDKPALSRRTFQNGIRLNEEQLDAADIVAVNQIRPGLYFDGLVEVAAVQDGVSLSAIDIRYANKTPDQRMNFKAKFQTFGHLLRAILAEMEKRSTVAA